MPYCTEGLVPALRPMDIWGMAGKVPKGLLTGKGALGSCVKVFRPTPPVEGAPNGLATG